MLAFSLLLASCGGKAGVDDTDDTGAQTGNGTITGGTSGIWSITAPVTYESMITDLDKAKSQTNFNMLDIGKSINECIPGSSVTVKNGKVTIKLGIPKDEYLSTIDEWFDGGIPETITVDHPDAKIIYDDDMLFDPCTEDEHYMLFCSSEEDIAVLVYVDRDVTIKGTYTRTYNGTTDTNTYNYNVSLKAGWNYMIGEGSHSTSMPTTSLPSGFSWSVYVGWSYRSQHGTGSGSNDDSTL
jgi:hypothetical protein